ncbi:chromosome segregation protein SMC [Niameybacter massiliensis]|uniref:Chromosome partition protein Smc n=1 Tax=Holtiella tumoricola TaxID=3018743 RepID=A0AA42J263_9FIRM|nr:chromosome segregation protein SMC [Holtiella tumoricola]MDA3733130.1 chromosome segregation protein SMC [Holtiella tumoricola]
MYLAKIEIHGFKSFGDAVKLSIPQGITAVIGPNGSGKSNVADAIRWVLGEQSAKTLRGTKMEDIIFAGTEKRKSLGYAEVAMYIKNDDHVLPIEYEEVVIKRRVYRSGESEYFINGSHCRLKDIQELFMDTGIGKEGYSIIGQGQIDKILSSKPEDRRSLFEEAAGIYKYKVRRLEAEKKLEKERENLLRIHDIMSEIESRLEPLEKEAEKTKSYWKLKDELKEVDINLYIEEVERIKQDTAKLGETLENIERELKDTNAQKDTILTRQTECKEKRQELFSELEKLLNHISQLEKDQQRQQASIQISEERISSIHQLIDQIDKDTKKQQDYKETMQNEHQVLKVKGTALELEEATKRERLIKKEAAFETEQMSLEQKEKNLESSKAEVFDKIHQIDLLKSEIDKQSSIEEQMDYRYSQLTEAIQTLNSDITHQEVSLQVGRKKEKETKEKLEQAQTAFNKLEEQRKILQDTLTELERSWHSNAQKKDQAKRQIAWLEQVKNDFEGYYQSVKQVLTIKKQEPEKWQGILGITADVIQVPKDYEIAIVTALGGAMQNIVTQTEQDAKAMIQLMKQRNISKVTFLPLDTIQAFGAVQDIAALRKETGFLGLGSELVTFDNIYGPVVANLLGRILIVDNMNHASQIARKYKYRYKIVTLDGEVFHAGGSLSGGASKNNKNNIFSRTRELKELQALHVQLEEETVVLGQAIKDHEAEKETLRVEWETLYKQCESLKETEKTIILEIDKGENSLKLTKQSQLQLVEEKLSIEEAKEVAAKGKDEVYDKIKALEETIVMDQESLKALEAELESLKSRREALRNELTEEKIALSTLVQNRKHIEEQIKNIEHNLSNSDEQHLNIIERKDSLLEDEKKIRLTIEDTHETIKKLGEEIENSKQSKVDLEKGRVQLEETLSNYEKEIERILERVAKLKEEHYRLTTRKEMVELEEKKQSDNMWEQYELTYSACLPFKKDMGPIVEMKKLADRLRAQIKVIGHVNVNAVVEFDETKTRFEFLSTQRQDIEKAEATLMELIDQLTAQMHEIFREQFTVIAENFSYVFKELFGGGMAFLQLVDEENILESGIEIIAKPPGKKLQNMTLLSGGERTLTAIALLFGILKLKPSPFCVLDEIEAALDDANVLRFAEYLGNLSKDTQFIVITHRKGTMERADTLYGVTMQERGVSTVLSIKLEEATKYLDKKTS